MEARRPLLQSAANQSTGTPEAHPRVPEEDALPPIELTQFSYISDADLINTISKILQHTKWNVSINDRAKPTQLVGVSRDMPQAVAGMIDYLIVNSKAERHTILSQLADDAYNGRGNKKLSCCCFTIHSHRDSTNEILTDIFHAIQNPNILSRDQFVAKYHAKMPHVFKKNRTHTTITPNKTFADA